MSQFPLESLRRPILQDVFTYPIRGSGKYLLITGGVLAIIKELCGFAPLIGLIAAFLMFGYFCAIFFEIVQSTATGSDEAPAYPEISNVVEDIISPALRVWIVGLVSILPWLLVLFFYPVSEWKQPLSYALLGFAAIYYPMAILAVAILGYLGAMSPHIVLPAIFRGGWLYILAIFLLAMVFLTEAFVSRVLQDVSPIIGSVIVCILGMYTLMANGRLLGLVYRERSEELNWL